MFAPAHFGRPPSLSRADRKWIEIETQSGELK